MERIHKLPVSFLIGFNSLYLGVNYLWISFESLILPTQIGAIVPESRMGLILGITAALGAGSGIAGNLSSGFLGDRFRILGSKRSPYVAIGVSLALVSVLIDGFLSNIIATIVLAYMLLQVFSNVAIGSIQPVIAEAIGPEQRGVSAGINGLFTLTGSALGFGLTGYLMTYYSQETAIYSIAGGLLITGVGALVTLASKQISQERLHSIRVSSLRHMPPDLRAFRGLTSGAFLVFMGITGLTYFELYFFKQILDVPDPQIYVAIAGIVVLALSAIASIILGHFSDRIGRWRILIITAAFSAVPTAMIPYFRSFGVFLVLGSLIGVSYGAFYSVSSALAGDLVPKREAGKYMAIFNLSLSGASTVSPLAYGAILFMLSANVHLSYVALFSASALFYLSGSATIFRASRNSGVVGHSGMAG